MAGVGAGSSAARIASDQPRSGPRSSRGNASRLPMTSTGIAAAKSAIRSTAPADVRAARAFACIASSSWSTRRSHALLHARDRALVHCAQKRPAHARVDRRVVEDQAGGVMLVERRVAILRQELRLLVRARGRIAVHRRDVVVACQEDAAVGKYLDRLDSDASARTRRRGRRRSRPADGAGRSCRCLARRRRAAPPLSVFGSS